MERGCEEIAELGPLKEGELRLFAKLFTESLKGGEVVILSGELGSGKTTFVKGMASGLGIDENLVKSPTFTLMNVYVGKLTLNHFDLYRIEDTKQLFHIGVEEILEEGEGVIVVEWGDLFPDFWDERIEIVFKVVSEDERELILRACGDYGEEVIREAIRKFEKSGKIREKAKEI